MTVVEQPASSQLVPVKIGGVRGGPSLSKVLRRDNWKFQPTVIALGLLGFVAYATWAALRNGSFYAGNVGRDYLSPFYSPCLTSECRTAGYVWGGWNWWRISPAILILVFPGAFRATCYYYRKSYYRSFWLSPPGCAVPDAGSTNPKSKRNKYTGETRFPLLIQNVHRYTWYFAVAFAVILTWDAIAAFRFPTGIGVGIGTLIFVANAVLIWAYTLGCHSCRHLCGGGLKSFKNSKGRYWFWKNIASELNERHQLFAWLSLFSILAADFYTWLVASGTVTDWKIL